MESTKQSIFLQTQQGALHKQTAKPKENSHRTHCTWGSSAGTYIKMPIPNDFDTRRYISSNKKGNVNFNSDAKKLVYNLSFLQKLPDECWHKAW